MLVELIEADRLQGVVDIGPVAEVALRDGEARGLALARRAYAKKGAGSSRKARYCARTSSSWLSVALPVAS